ncbi:MAG: HlyD family efflux transporter periplasmic adaptor subunit, partial [Planctomycetes bacterium]|nr:HlyD family efflux transporter periplasmic adaptor subunit [Planctomycetota bacterium]
YAEKALAKSELDVERTEIVAPFNSIIQEKYIEKHQIVGQASKIVTLIGTDKFWVQVNVPVSNLKYIKLPNPNKENGSNVEIYYELSDGQKVERSGKVIRFLGNLEQAGRMSRLIVEIDDPFNLKKQTNASNFPMFLNAFVHVKIHGSKLPKVVSIPRGHLHEGNKVWIMNKMQQLEIRKINVLWKRDNDVLISTKHLKPGEMLITSKISTPVQNLQLRIQGMSKESSKTGTRQSYGKSNFDN